MPESEASWQASAALQRMRSILLANIVKEKLRNLQRAIKANFDPNQPRVPRGNPDGGQWTRTGGGSGRPRVAQMPRVAVAASAAMRKERLMRRPCWLSSKLVLRKR